MAARKPRAKAKPQPKEPPQPIKPEKLLIQLDPQRKEEIAAIGVFILALLTLLGAFNLTGGVLLDDWVHFLQNAFGWGVYLAPFLLFALSVWLVLDSLDKIVNIGWERPLGMALAYFLLLAALHWLSALNNPLQAPTRFQGGGVLGWAIAAILINSSARLARCSRSSLCPRLRSFCCSIFRFRNFSAARFTSRASRAICPRNCAI